MIVFADTETFSDIPIRNGSYKYSENVEILLFTYAFDDGPVKLWDKTKDPITPKDLQAAFDDPSAIFVFHNGGNFDRVMIEKDLKVRIPPERIHDTMAAAYSHGFPGGLDVLCDILKVPVSKAKDKEGKKLIQLFCMPRPIKQKLRRATRETHPVEWARFCAYAMLDIEAMRFIYNALPKWNYTGFEKTLWDLDQKINERGIAIDVEFAEGATRAIKRAQASLAKRTSDLTLGLVESATRRDALLQHILAAYGVELPDMQSSTLEHRMEDPELPAEVKDLLGIRLQASSTSTAKYAVFLRNVSSDGRLRGSLQFAGASRTKRWAGRGVQLQNLMRPTLKPYDKIAFGIDAIKCDAEELFYDNVMELCANAVRGCIVAAPGRKLCVSDLANIEGRMAAWLAGEKWKLDAFRAYDAGTGPDLYKVAYAAVFKILVSMVDGGAKSGPQRQIGKVCLAEGTRVMVRNGYKPIELVTINDEVWDGIEWVKHEGLAANGVRQVVNVAGIKLTPDHLILTHKIWRPARELVSNENILSQALEVGSANLPFSHINDKNEARAPSTWRKFLARVVRPPILSILTLLSKETARDAERAQNKSSIKNVGGNTLTQCLKTITARVFSLDLLRPLSVAPHPTIGGGAITGAAASKFQMCGEKIVPSFYGMFAHCRVGTILLLKWIDATQTVIMKKVTSGLSVGDRIWKRVAPSGNSKNRSVNCNKRMPTYDLVCAGPRHRFMVLTDQGPILVHNCELMLQYGGGVGAFITGALTYNIDLTEMARRALPGIPKDILERAEWWWDESVSRKMTYDLTKEVFMACDGLKRLWRAAHPQITSIWPDLEDAVRNAVESKDKVYTCRRLAFDRKGNWLRMHLPSGFYLCYAAPRVKDNGEISYMGMNQYSRKWGRLKTYGGKIFENGTQAGARDVMAANMPLVEEAGYPIITHTHDELITEPRDHGSYSVGNLSMLLAAELKWSEGLPLAASGFEDYRYRKDD